MAARFDTAALIMNSEHPRRLMRGACLVACTLFAAAHALRQHFSLHLLMILLLAESHVSRPRWAMIAQW